MKYKIGICGMGFVGTAVSVGLDRVAEVWEHDKFKDSYSLQTIVDECEIIFLCLPTPMQENRTCDTSIIEEVVYNINKITEHPKTLAIKSTILPGTTQRLAEKYPVHTFIFNPEFLTEKNFISDFLLQNKIILGLTTENRAGVKIIRELYNNFVQTQEKPAGIYTTSSQVAEMLKYFTNSFLATKVIFCNEIKQICEAAGITYEEVVNLLVLDERIGLSHLSVPGPEDGLHGFGGSCFSKDINALVAFAESLGVDPLILDSVWAKNLMVREKYDWENLAQVTGKYEKK